MLKKWIISGAIVAMMVLAQACVASTTSTTQLPARETVGPGQRASTPGGLLPDAQTPLTQTPGGMTTPGPAGRTVTPASRP